MELISNPKDCLRYDEKTGLFYWTKFIGGNSKVGEIAGNKTKNGYVSISIGNKKYLAHRLALYFIHGKWPKITDHINRKRDDNRIINLREVTHHESNINKRPHKKARSGFRGVVRRNDCPNHPFRATAKDETGRQVNLGYHATAEEAQKAYIDYYASRGIKIDLT